MIVAGEEPYRLSGSLYCLARDVGIPPPQFYGRQVYYDGNGAEKWLITTLIQGRIGEDDDPGVWYTQAYPDWSTSVEMAIHGAMSRVIFKYRDHVPRSGVFRFLGERAHHPPPHSPHGEGGLSCGHGVTATEADSRD